MNQAVGTVDTCYDQMERGESYSSPHCGVPDLAVNGPWLNGGQLSNFRNDPYATYRKFSGVLAPGPSTVWVLVDENAAGLNDAAFSFEMVEPAWLDAPGSYHNGGCGFAFVDGHSEVHNGFQIPSLRATPIK
jgi:prepilin-type processing-associated H-X9-DG protein